MPEGEQKFAHIRLSKIPTIERRHEGKWKLNLVIRKKIIKKVNMSKDIGNQTSQSANTDKIGSGVTPQKIEMEQNDKSVTADENTIYEYDDETMAFKRGSSLPEHVADVKSVVLDVDASPEKIDSSFDYFQMSRPNLLISLTGNENNCHLNLNIKDQLVRGLSKFIKECGAWVIGDDKFKGDGAVNQIRVISGVSNGNVISIEITPGENTKFRAIHLNEKESDETESVGKRGLCYLDSDRVHHMMMGELTKDKDDAEILIRRRLKDYFEEKAIPTVMLVVEDKASTLKSVMEAMKNGIPVIILKGSGNVSDVIAFAYEHSVNNTLPQEAEICVRKMLQKFTNDDDIIANIQVLKFCLANRDMITISEYLTTVMTSHDHTDTEDLFIKDLITANKGNVMLQARLALTLNRVDIARDCIFIDNKNIETKDLFYFMFFAIKDGKADFVEYLLENGFCLEDFLNVRRHEKLYSFDCIPEKSQLKRLIIDVKLERGTLDKPVSIKDVRSLLKSLINMGILNKYETNWNPRKPYLSLFIWSVLTDKMELARLFWLKGKSPIATALLGHALCMALTHTTYDTEVKKILRKDAEMFNGLAIGVLNECFSTDEKRTEKLIIQELDNFDKSTCIRIAFDVYNRDFIAQKSVQNLLNKIWYGGISDDNSVFKFVVSPIFLGIFVLKFQEDCFEQKHVDPWTLESKSIFIDTVNNDRKSSTVSDNHTEKRMNDKYNIASKSTVEFWYKKMLSTRMSGVTKFVHKVKIFYSAPIIVFAHYMIAYVIFLLLFSYMLLVEFSQNVSNCDILLFVWTATILLDEIHQVATMREDVGRSSSLEKKKRKCSYYFKKCFKAIGYYLESSWNQIDMLTIVLFLTGVILRFMPYSNTLEASRVVYGICLLGCFFRILRCFAVNKELGPKLTMIHGMIVDLLYFIIILLVFIMSYAITAHSILYPNSKFDGELVVNVLRLGYFNIYGELFLEDIEISEPDCSFDPLVYNNGTLPQCRERFRQVFTLVLLGIYILISNVLLLNILIAMFGNTFNRVQEETNKYWFYQRLSLIREVYNKPFLPAPFAAPLFILMFIKWVISKCRVNCCRCAEYKDTAMHIRLRGSEKDQLSQWEEMITNKYVTLLKHEEQSLPENRTQLVINRIDHLSDQIVEMYRERDESFVKPLKRLEQKMDSIIKLLEKNKHCT